MDVARTTSVLALLLVVALGGCGSTPGPSGGPASGGAPATCAVGEDPPFSAPPDPAATLAECAIPGGTLGALADTADSLPDVGNGAKAGDATDAPLTLPEDVALRTSTETFNRR
jgi:hypothetical protein